MELLSELRINDAKPKGEKMMAIDFNYHVCPLNNFKVCFEKQCPFWGIVNMILDGNDKKVQDVYGCLRVKKEIENNGRKN